jgi:hypothetical protein
MVDSEHKERNRFGKFPGDAFGLAERKAIFLRQFLVGRGVHGRKTRTRCVAAENTTDTSASSQSVGQKKLGRFKEFTPSTATQQRDQQVRERRKARRLLRQRSHPQQIGTDPGETRSPDSEHKKGEKSSREEFG